MSDEQIVKTNSSIDLNEMHLELGKLHCFSDDGKKNTGFAYTGWLEEHSENQAGIFGGDRDRFAWSDSGR